MEIHKRFIADHRLSFSLLPNTDGKIAHVTDGIAADQHVTDVKETISQAEKALTL